MLLTLLFLMWNRHKELTIQQYEYINIINNHAVMMILRFLLEFIFFTQHKILTGRELLGK